MEQNDINELLQQQLLTLKKIHFWIKFWSILAIIGIIFSILYLLTYL